VLLLVLAAGSTLWSSLPRKHAHVTHTHLTLQARERLSKRPWRVDDYDQFCQRVYGPDHTSNSSSQAGPHAPPAAAAAAAAAGVGAVGQIQQQLAGMQLQQQQQLQQGSDGPAWSEDISPFSLAASQPDGTAAATAAAGQAASRSSSKPAASAAASAASEARRAAGQPPFRRVMVFVDNAGAQRRAGM
jgi:hypothetical protein